ncbi:outer membrane beta-barrel family protein [Lutibacter flavus]|uniref:Outer membrane receptor for ferrienterochelin and colicins n=1 Tax=Lutibacter flavus TaxID=691689 RepID=A0A238VGY2_9FLAO|nr:outer membrane beta-barrel family protein [Lutibacter flavus]SNR33461.1 Outer membrane receptor for ferrienterochelin and colicins [Lutibacter flavus]
MRRILLLLIILPPLISFSQKKSNPTYTISGKIIDSSTKKPLEDATVIFKSIDSNTIKCGGITNARGNFNIDVEEGTYNASVTYISYKEKKINISTISRDFNIGTIALETDTEFLDAIEILGEKKTIEFKPNKIVFNVGKDLMAAGGTAADILNNIPSVSVDPAGGITVRGKGQVQVLINGKTSLLSKESALKSLPAGSLENIEVITNPGAQYNASALSIINIILKKGVNEGLNASITGTGGYKDYYGSLITLNHKTQKTNFYTNVSFNSSNPITTSISESEYFENNTTSSFLNENSEFNSKNNTFYTTVGADFYLSNRTTLTTSINYQNLNQKRNTLTNSDIFDPNQTPTSTNNRNHIGKYDNEAMEYIINLEHNFKKEGQKLTSFVQYINDVDTFNNTITNSNINYISEDYIEKNKLTNTTFELKFTNPIGESSAITTGYQSEFGKIPFEYLGTNFSNKIDYSENIHKAFIEYEYELSNYYFGIGLRTELTKNSVDYKSLNTKQDNSFNDFFPAVYTEYSISETKSISIGYDRGIKRPGLLDRQPFQQKFSETSFYKGNPELNPIYTDNASLSFTYYGNKITFAPAIIFTRYTDMIQDVTYETGEQIEGVDKTITTPVNLGKVDYYGMNISTIYKPNKILSFSSNITIMNFDQTGTFETVNSANETISLDYNNVNLNGEFSLLTQLKIPNLFNFQINAKHYLISKAKYSTRKAYTYASAAINKDLFNDKATLSLTVNDLFLSNDTNRDRFNPNYFSKSLIENKYRTILLSYTYRFNQSKKDRKIDFDRKENKPIY